MNFVTVTTLKLLFFTTTTYRFVALMNFVLGTPRFLRTVNLGLRFRNAWEAAVIASIVKPGGASIRKPVSEVKVRFWFVTPSVTAKSLWFNF